MAGLLRIALVAWVVGAASAAPPADLPPEWAAWRRARLAAEAPELPASAYAQAMAGETLTGLVDVEGSNLRKAWGLAVVDVPLASMWAAVNDNASKVEVTRLSYVEQLEGEPCRDDRVVFQYLDIRWLTDRWWVVRQRQNGALLQKSRGRAAELVWQSVRDPQAALSPKARSWARHGMPLPFTAGSWMLVDLGNGRTLVEYFSWSDPGGSIPAGIASRFARRGIVENLEAITRLARTGPGCGGDGIASP